MTSNAGAITAPRRLSEINVESQPQTLWRLRKNVVLCAALSLASIPLSCHFIARNGEAESRDEYGPAVPSGSSDKQTFPRSKKPRLFDSNWSRVSEYQEYINKWAEQRTHVAAQAGDIFRTNDLTGQAMYAIYNDDSRFGKASVWNASVALVGTGLIPPRKKMVARGSMILDQAPCYVAMPARPFANVHAHILIDHLPALALLREEHDADGCDYLLQDTPVLRKVLEWLDPQFAADRVVWLETGSNKMVKMGKQVILRAWAVPRNPIGNGRNPKAVQALRRWLVQVKYNDDDGVVTTGRDDMRKSRRIVYASRNSPTATHARALDLNHEKDVLELILAAMERYNIRGMLEVYNGLDQEGNPVSLQQQFEIFSTADVVIGAHGGALANVMWMSLGRDKEENAKVFEFIPSESVQPKKKKNGSENIIRWVKTYYYLFQNPEWVDYRHLALSPNSTADASFINLSSLDEALDDMWSDPAENTKRMAV